MKMFKKIFVLASCATMLMAGSAVANAHCCEYNNVCDTKAYQTQAVQDVLFTSGKIVEVNENMIVVKGEHNIIAAMITDDTYLLNGKNGKAKKLSSFKVGKEVTVYYSSKMTRSIPAQSAAFAVVLGDSSEKMGKFFKVEEVTMSEDNTYVSVINTNLMVWYDMMTMSLPARTNANKVVIL